MEQRSTAEDVHRCDLCETIVHSYCDFCHANLCKPCIGEHISDGYDKLKIVPFKDRRSTYNYPKCKEHVHKNCKFQCKDCDMSVCSSCMASEQHRGHIFTDVLVVYEKRKRLVENHIKKLEETIIPEYEEKALDYETQLANLDGIYEKLTAEITRHGEQWHREIDIIINKMKNEVRETKERHRDVLQTHFDEIKQKQESKKKVLLELRDIIKSNEVSQIKNQHIQQASTKGAGNTANIQISANTRRTAAYFIWTYHPYVYHETFVPLCLLPRGIFPLNCNYILMNSTIKGIYSFRFHYLFFKLLSYSGFYFYLNVFTTPVANMHERTRMVVFVKLMKCNILIICLFLIIILSKVDMLTFKM